MKIYVRGLNNDMIKPSKNYGLTSVVDFVTYKELINGTTLRSFITPQVRKMTPKLRQICRCELCIILKDMHIDLNRFITGLVIYLEQKSVGRHTRNSLFSTTSDAHYKDKVLTYGEILHATIKDAAQCINCIPIKPKNTIHIKCDYFFNINVPSKILLMKN